MAVGISFLKEEEEEEDESLTDNRTRERKREENEEVRKNGEKSRCGNWEVPC